MLGPRQLRVVFVILSVIGLAYLGGSYLGIVDRVLGRGYQVDVLLPTSGGLYEGSEVTYRGVKVGEVAKMTVEADGLRVKLRMRDGTKIPAGSPVYVHNLSAVGEQYLDFEPATTSGPMLQNGDVVRGAEDSVPLGEDVLITHLSGLVKSLDQESLTTLVDELGLMFHDNALPLRSLVDDAQLLVQAAIEHEDDTTTLLRSGKTVLQTQAAQGDNIRAFSRDLASLMGTLEKSDSDIRTILQDADPAVREATALVDVLAVELPPTLAHLVGIADVLDARLPALEQLLVTFPRLVAAGPSALTERGGEKFGRISLNLNQLPACAEGYLPSTQWRSTSQVDFLPYYPAKCLSDAPINMRGMKYAPAPIDWRKEYLGEDQ